MDNGHSIGIVSELFIFNIMIDNFFHSQHTWKCGYCSEKGIGRDLWIDHLRVCTTNRVQQYKDKLTTYGKQLEQNQQEREKILKNVVELPFNINQETK